MRSLGHFQMTECNGWTTGVSLVQSVPMRLVIVNVAYGPQGDATCGRVTCRRMKCPHKDPPGRNSGVFPQN